jgi:hypothetical protein
LFNILLLLSGQEATSSCFLLTGGIDDADPDPEFFYADADADPDLTFYPEVDPDPDPSFQIKDQTLEKVLK